MRAEQAPNWRTSVHWLTGAVRDVSNVGSVSRRRRLPDGVLGEDLARAADFHGVPGFAQLAADHAPEAVNRAAHQAQARHLRALSDLGSAGRALSSARIDVLVVKGPALVSTCYGPTQLRSYVDLDLLVRPADLRDAIRALERAGFRLLDANWPVLVANRVHELRLEGPTGGAVDLHWSLSQGPGAEDTAPSARTLMSRATRIPAGTQTFLSLSPPDLVVHVAVHAAGSGGHRLVWLTDLRGAWAYVLHSASEADVIDTAREWQALPALSLMTRRARRLEQGDRPGRSLTASAPLRLWTGLDSFASSIQPPEYTGEGGSVPRLLARSSRPTVSASLATAVAKTVTWARTGGGAPPGSDVMHDRTNPHSALFSSGGVEAREAFFDAVAQED